MENALEAAPKPGAVARALVVAAVPGEAGHFVLSLRPGAVAGAGGKKAAGAAAGGDAPPESLAAADLKPGQQVGRAPCVQLEAQKGSAVLY